MEIQIKQIPQVLLKAKQNVKKESVNPHWSKGTDGSYPWRKK